MTEKKDILNKVDAYIRGQKSKEFFVPGKTPVPVSGRVFDQDEVVRLVSSALDFWLTAGPYAKECEEALAHFTGRRHCMLVNSGSSANLLAISALTSQRLEEKSLKKGDEVITTACGFPTTLNPIIQNQLKPVFVDVEVDTLAPTAQSIEKALSSKTRAVILPHTLGNPFDLESVCRIAAKRNLWLIEDNCDALGSRFDGKPTGSFGHMATSSFYPAHHITMGEGGAVFTNDDVLKDILCSFRDWGRDCWCLPGKSNTCNKRFAWQLGDLPHGYDHKYIYSHIGYNLKLTDLQAAIGIAQLKKLPEFIRIRKKNFDRLYGHLVQYEKYLILPRAHPAAEPSWFGFPVFIKEEAPFSREKMVDFLTGAKIDTRMIFAGNLTRQPAYQNIDCRIAGKLVNSDRIMQQMFWVGVYPGITEPMMNYVLEKFSEFFTAQN